MFADTRYLPVPSLPGPPLGSSCHGSLQRFKGAICFSRSCLHNGYLPHRGQMHRDRRGPGRLKYKSPRCKAFICDYTSPIFFIFLFFDLPGPFAFFFIAGWDDKHKQGGAFCRLFVCFFCRQLPMHVTMRKEGKETLISCACMCAHVEERR